MLTLIDGKLRIFNGALVLSDSADDPCCCDPCRYVVCISVIDEDSSNEFFRDDDWAAFRAAWPDRKFFLLKPSPQPVPLLTPAGWDGTGPINVARDGGNAGEATDWYDVCNLDNNLSFGGKIALFIDQSGSMDLGTVQASYDLFLTRLNDRVQNGRPDPVTVANGRLILVFNGNERWILPHISFEDCPTTA
jgi:hypothetical protein